MLFLDEIADLELSLQGKLLRVLQEGKVQAVGSDREVAVDVRVVAATNCDPATLVREGRFRLDLFHRLAVLETRLPSLSERGEDIPLLIEHFVRKHAPQRGLLISAAFGSTIRRSNLPGNVRQLEILMRRILAEHPQDKVLEVEMIPGQLSDSARHPEAASCYEAARARLRKIGSRDSHDGWNELLAAADSNLVKAMAMFEGKLLQAARASSHGNQSLAASFLGITPRSVYNLIRRHGLAKPVKTRDPSAKARPCQR